MEFFRVPVVGFVVDSDTMHTDFESMANLHISLGFAYVSRGDPAEAEHHLREAGELYHRLGDAAGEARSHVGLTHVFDPQGRHSEAAEHADKALDQYRMAPRAVLLA